MSTRPDKDKPKFVAQCIVNGVTKQSFDATWSYARSLPLPVSVTFDKFVRVKD